MTRFSQLAGLCGLIALSACFAGSIREPDPAPDRGDVVDGFSHRPLDRVLASFAEADGRVSYTALYYYRNDLDSYAGQLARFSPDSHPHLFGSDADRLAYWLNAYNASVLRAVVDSYPIQSVLDVRPPTLLLFLPRRSGFYLFKRFLIGGSYYSLWGLDRLARSRFDDVRIALALHRATLGGAAPAPRAYTGATLEEDLDRQARRFAASEANVRIDLGARTVHLSPLFGWYEGDFRRRQRELGRPAELLGFVADLLEPDKAALLQACAGCRVEFEAYDWRLNDRIPAP